MPTASHILPPEVTLSGGTIYAVQGDIYALDAKTGQLLQHYDVAADRPPIIIDDSMYSTDIVGNAVQASHTLDGSLLWKTEIEGHIHSQHSLTIDAGIIYFSTYLENFIYALRTSDGSLLWRYSMDKNFIASPTLDTASQILYIASTGGSSNDPPIAQILALRASDGTLLWSAPLANGCNTPVTIWEDALYVSAYDACIALNKTNGNFLWQHKIEHALISTPVIANGTVYLSYWLFRHEYVFDDAEPHFEQWQELLLCALDTSTGTLLWQEHLSTNAKTAPMQPCVAHNVLYTSSEGTLWAFQATTGVLLWSYYTNGESLSTPIVENDVVYVGVNDGNVCALDASTGTLLWQTFVSTAISMVASIEFIESDTTIRILDPEQDE